MGRQQAAKQRGSPASGISVANAYPHWWYDLQSLVALSESQSVSVSVSGRSHLNSDE